MFGGRKGSRWSGALNVTLYGPPDVAFLKQQLGGSEADAAPTEAWGTAVARIGATGGGFPAQGGLALLCTGLSSTNMHGYNKLNVHFHASKHPASKFEMCPVASWRRGSGFG